MFILIKIQYKIVTSDLWKGVFTNYINYSYYIYTIGHRVFVVEIIQSTDRTRPLKNGNFRSLRLSVRVQGRRKIQPQVQRSKCPWGEYIEYFED